MIDSPKLLARGNINATISSPSVVYIPSATNRTTIIKSFILCNASGSSVEVLVTLGNVYFMRYTMKANETLVLPIVDQYLSNTNDSIRIGSNFSGAVDYYISGVELELNDKLGEYYSVRKFTRMNVASSSLTIVSSASFRRVIKSFVMCNTSSSAVTLRVNVGDVNLLWDYSLKGYETVVVPTMDLILEANDGIIARNTTAATNVAFHITGRELQ